MGAAAAVRERHRAGRPARQPLWPSDPFLGPERPPQRANHRSRCQSPDGARGAAGPRSRAGVRLPRCRCRYTNLEGSIWTWWREDGKFHIEKTATIPPEPAPADDLPPLLKGFGAVPPLVTDIDLSLDDRFLYVACWGTGELRQY